MRQERAFMLVEGLIVLAMIAVLAAIAIPNFLERETRARLAGVRSDLRHVAQACDAYAVDSGLKMYPFGVISFITPERESANWGWLTERLTTPVAYLPSLPFDPFGEDYLIPSGSGQPPVHSHAIAGSLTTRYRMVTRQIWPGRQGMYSPSPAEWLSTWPIFSTKLGAPEVIPYLLTSIGPDRIEDVIPPYSPRIYDPSNGTVSWGDVVRFGAFTR